jgi:hypothetical protein
VPCAVKSSFKTCLQIKREINHIDSVCLLTKTGFHRWNLRSLFLRWLRGGWGGVEGVIDRLFSVKDSDLG